MAFLTIAGITVSVDVSSAAEKEATRIGSEGRTYSGALRSTVRIEKREFACTTTYWNATQIDALYAATYGGQHVVIGGDWLGSRYCSVQFAGIQWSQVSRTQLGKVSLTIKEV